MKFFTALLLTIFPISLLACSSVNGIYTTVSETHWNYELTIKDDRAKLVYTDHWYGEGDTYTESQVVYSGYCKKKSDDMYKLQFAGVSTEIKYIASLSKASIGEDTSAKGFISKLFNDHYLELWSADSFQDYRSEN